MTEQEIWIIITWLLSALTFTIIGYCFAERESIGAIRRVDHWISTVEDNRWVQYTMYEELEKKYEDCLKEYEQYRGMIKAIKDHDGDVE